jgi:predicted dehydrogenase
LPRIAIEDQTVTDPARQSRSPLRVAIAGFGQAGRCHAATWAGMPEAEVVGVYSLRPDVERGDIASVCGPGVPVFGDFRAMLDAVDCDFVSICTLHDTHAAYAIEAISRGKHVLLEKPICLTVAELEAVRAAVARSSSKVCIGFQEFHYGQFEATLNLIAEGYLGHVHLAEIDYMNGVGPWMPQHWWARTKAVGGSSMLFCGCHPLMLLMLVMGGAPVEEVMAYQTRSASPHFDALEYPGTQVNLVRFADGRIGKVTSCLDSLNPYYFRCTLIGSEGTLIDRRLNSRKLKGLDPQGWTEIATRSVNDAGDIKPDMFVDMFRRILAHVRDDAPMPYSGFASAYDMHRVLFASEEAVRTGKPVKVDSFIPRLA